MRIRRSVQCPTCGTNYFEDEGTGCPKCSGQAVGVARPLAGPMADFPSSGGAARAAAVSGGAQPFDPVCGWLVCLAGANSGRYLRVFPGKNSIGGGRDCMLPLDFIPGAHEGAAALLLYDNIANRFWLVNGPGRDLVRLGGELLLSPAELTGGETLDVAGVPFRFVPLCGPKFRWS